MRAETEGFQVHLSFKGKTTQLDELTTATTGEELEQRVLQALGLPEDGTVLKLLFKGKRLQNGPEPVFASVPKKTPKIVVMASSTAQVKAVSNKKSDPTVRGFDQEIDRSKIVPKQSQHWGPDLSAQDKTYKFGKIVACTWQSFGHRPTEETPHAFAAMQLLQRMATDPGVVAIMKERELYVGTLGEMDPIDDRLMQKKEQEGRYLLGYNTNRGLSIDIKLRSNDLSGFRPYAELVSTLIHELSHNWVSDHNLLFWTNFGQMRAEYLHTHARLRGTLVDGKTTAELAGLSKQDLDDVYGFVMRELAKDMAQHQLHPNAIAAPIQERCRQLDQQQKQRTGERLGGGGGNVAAGAGSGMSSARELALAAAERRARERQEGDRQDQQQ